MSSSSLLQCSPLPPCSLSLTPFFLFSLVQRLAFLLDFLVRGLVTQSTSFFPFPLFLSLCSFSPSAAYPPTPSHNTGPRTLLVFFLTIFGSSVFSLFSLSSTPSFVLSNQLIWFVLFAPSPPAGFARSLLIYSRYVHLVYPDGERGGVRGELSRERSRRRNASRPSYSQPSFNSRRRYIDRKTS